MFGNLQIKNRRKTPTFSNRSRKIRQSCPKKTQRNHNQKHQLRLQNHLRNQIRKRRSRRQRTIRKTPKSLPRKRNQSSQLLCLLLQRTNHQSLSHHRKKHWRPRHHRPIRPKIRNHFRNFKSLWNQWRRQNRPLGRPLLWLCRHLHQKFSPCPRRKRRRLHRKYLEILYLQIRRNYHHYCQKRRKTHHHR